MRLSGQELNSKFKYSVYLRPLVYVFTVVLTVAGLLACDGRPTYYVPIDEIPDGPGLITGEDGSFIILK